VVEENVDQLNKCQAQNLDLCLFYSFMSDNQVSI